MAKKKVQFSMAPRIPKKKGQSKKWYMDKIMIGASGAKQTKHRCNREDLFPSKPNYLTDEERIDKIHGEMAEIRNKMIKAQLSQRRKIGLFVAGLAPFIKEGK